MRWWTSIWAWAGLLPTFHQAAEEEVVHEGGRYLLHRVEQSELGALRLHWLDEQGQPLSNFGGLRALLERRGERIVFATNAGIYERGPKPCGLTVAGGEVQVALNVAEGEGNFYLKPNGVFYVDEEKGAGVLETGAFATSGLKPRLATQSGPLLLANGKIHPVFKVDSEHRRQRSGVGVRAVDGQVIFAMNPREDRERGRVTFHQMARLFLHLGCDGALYLDGDISDFAVRPADDAGFTPQTFAGMLVEVELR